MKKVFIYFFILFFVNFAVAQNEAPPQIDSLRNIITTQHGLEKLDSYLLLGSFLFKQPSPEELKVYFEEYEIAILQEQKKEKNSELMKDYVAAYAMLKFNHSAFFINQRKYEEAEEIIRSAMDYAFKNEAWFHYYRLYNQLLKMLTQQQKYELVQREAKKLYEDAKMRNQPVGMIHATLSLLNIYIMQHRYAETENAAKECINLANTINFKDICYELVQARHFYGVALNLQGKYNELLPALQKQEEVIQKIEKLEAEVGNKNLNYRLRLYYSYSAYYVNIKDYNKADEYCNLMYEILRSYLNDRTVHHCHYYLMRAQILYERGQYVEAMDMIEKYDQILYPEDLANPIDHLDFLKLKAALLMRLGNKEESIALYDSIVSSLFNFREAEFNVQIDELHTLYEVDKHIAEKARNRYYFLFTLACCVMLIALLGAGISFYRKKEKKNRDLYRQIIAQGVLEEQLENERKKNQNLRMQAQFNNLEFSANEAEDEKFKKLNILMKEQLLYTDCDIKRNDIALKVGLSDRALHDCLKNNIGMSFMEYINHLRLSHSRELLLHVHKLTIEAIAMEVGFNSRNTFYRLFLEKYGLSPAEFKRIAQQQGSTPQPEIEN